MIDRYQNSPLNYLGSDLSYVYSGAKQTMRLLIKRRPLLFYDGKPAIDASLYGCSGIRGR